MCLSEAGRRGRENAGSCRALIRLRWARLGLSRDSTITSLTSLDLTGGTLRTDANPTAARKICSQLSNQEMESSP